jgi:palmitoyltransferase
VFVAEAAKQSPVLFATTSACVLLMIVSWAVLVYVYRDPGTVYEDRAKTYSQLFEDVASSGSEPDPRKWCTTTLVRKPLRAKYDAPTGLLVARHDHFCVWLDTAVGFGNHRVFMVFVFFQVASHYLFATFGWMNIVAFLEAQSATDFCDVTTLLFSPRVWGLFVLTLCATICALGLSFLLGQQTDGAFTNITTNERINKKRYNWLLDDEGKRFVNRFDTGSLLANFTEFLTKSKDYTRT